MNVERALRFARAHGDELQRYRVDFHCKGLRDDRTPLNYYRKRQGPAGEFPYDLEQGNPASTNETTGVMGTLAELDLSKSDVADKAIDYVLSIQSSDGSWDENHEIKKLNPPPWDMPGELMTRIWLTSQTAANLVSLGKGNLEAVKRAADFLLQNRDETGRFSGYRITTWICIPLFSFREGKNSDTVRTCLEHAEKWVEEETDPGFLVWYLECLTSAGLALSHPVASKCLEKLAELQRDDGSFSSVDGDRYVVSNTIGAVRFLASDK